MDLDRAEYLAECLMLENGLYDCGWKFRYNNRKRSLGLCNYRKKLIMLSRDHVRLNSEEKVKDTILHEIAHALTPGDGHGLKWKAKCIELGATPSAYDYESEMPKAKWALVVALDNGELIYRRGMFRKSNKDYSRYYIEGRYEETIGRMKVIPMAEFEAWKRRNIEIAKEAA